MIPELAIITAKIAQLSLGLGGFSGSEVNAHANESLAELSSRNTITLSAPEQASFLQQNGIVDCPWINPFPDGSRPPDGAEAPPHVTCEIFQDPNGGLPTLRAYVSNWPQDKASMVAFSFKGSDSVIVTTNLNSATVNLQTLCGIGPVNQWFLRGMSGWIWESGDFISTETASSACFDAVNEPTIISITDPTTGLEKQFIFNPKENGHNGNQAAFKPFRRDQYDTNKIFFDPNNEASARTLIAMQLAIEEQLQIATNRDIIVWPSMSFADSTRLLERIPYPTPTPLPTVEVQATAIPPYVEPQAAIITAIEAAPQEIANKPTWNISLDLQVAGSNVTIYKENPLATERVGLNNYINALNSTVDQKSLDIQYGQIEDVNAWEWFKSLFGKYEYALYKVPSEPVNIARVLHINFGESNDRTMIIDGLDINGKFVRVVLPVKGNISVHEDYSVSFKSKTRFKFNAIDKDGVTDEASFTLARLTEQIANYYDLGSKTKTIPEVVVVPSVAVPILYRDSNSRNAMTYDAQALRSNYPDVVVTLAYYDATGAQYLVPNFALPTGMLGRAKQLLTFNGVQMYEVDISLEGEHVNGNTIDQITLKTITDSLPSGVTPHNGFITIYVPAENIAAVPSDKFNPAAPTPGPATATPTPYLSPTPSFTPAPTQTPPPGTSRFPQGDEIHEMDPRIITGPSSYVPSPALLIARFEESKRNEWERFQVKRARNMIYPKPNRLT